MSSPTLRTDSDHVDQNFPVYYSDNLWSILDDHRNPILENDGYDKCVGLDHIIHGQQNSSFANLIENRVQIHSSLLPLEASHNRPCPLVHEHNMLLAAEEDDDKTSCELNSCVFPYRGKILALDKGLLENSIYDHGDHDYLETNQDAFESLGQILGQNHDASDKELQGNSNKHHNCDNSLSNCTPDQGTSNDTWLLLEEGNISLNVENNENSGGFDSIILTKQAEASPVQASIDKRLLGKNSNTKTKFRNHKLKQLPKKGVQPNGEEGQISKKQEHNAKEKIRRMKINATYLDLGALLPDHRRTKKRRSAPVVIDKALEYIPELEKEIEDLTLRKNNLLSTVEKQNLTESPQLSDKFTVLLHEVVKGEVIIQIVCIQKDQETTTFSNILQNVEAQGMSILSASTLQVCKERVCYHLHIQMNGSLLAADYMAIFRERVISWLSTLA